MNRPAHPLRCRCGTLRGLVHRPETARRAICHCRDCQAAARFLGEPARTLDAQGGTDIAAILPADLAFSAGTEAIACFSLSPAGLLRWYAGCCRTPLANTPRNPQVAYVGLLHDVLDTPPADLDASFGPPRVRVHTESATGSVPGSSRLAGAATMLHLTRRLLVARLGGGWRGNPFFPDGTARPLREPQVLSREQRSALMENPG